MFSFIRRSGILNSRILSKIIQENNSRSLGSVINREINHTSRELDLKCGRHTLAGSVKYIECSNLLYRQCQPLLHQNRSYRAQRSKGNKNESNDDTTPDLMDFPWIIWPSILMTMKNWIFAKTIIPYFDEEFNLKSFKEGSKQALVAVSGELSQGNFEELQPFVALDALGDLKRNFTAMSIKQRMDLAVAEEDIFLAFPHEIGVIYKNEGSQMEQTFVEITMCFHVFRGFDDHIRKQADKGLNETVGIKSVYANIDRISIANYRFIREFTKGVEDDWTINLLNHFKPGEHLKK